MFWLKIPADVPTPRYKYVKHCYLLENGSLEYQMLHAYKCV